MISLVALILLSFQIIGPIMKNVSIIAREKSSFPTLKPRKKSLVTQRSSTHWSWWISSKVEITPKLKNCVWKMIASWLLHHRAPWCFYQPKSKECVSYKFNIWYRWAVKERCSFRWCESINEDVRIETSAYPLDSWYAHLPKATERIDSERSWERWHKRSSQVSKWSYLRESKTLLLRNEQMKCKCRFA